MSKIAIIFLHLGSEDSQSKKNLEKIRSDHLDGITKINVTDPKRKQQLENNTKGIVIKKYPIFLIAQENKTTQQYSCEEYDTIKEIYQTLLNITD